MQDITSKIAVSSGEYFDGGAVSVKEAVLSIDSNTGLKTLKMAEVKDRAKENHRMSAPDLSNTKYQLDFPYQGQVKDAKMTQDLLQDHA